MSRVDIKLVVLGLDFMWFLNVPDVRPLDKEAESRLAITRGGSVNLYQGEQQARDVIHALLTLDALLDSASTLAANRTSRPGDIVDGNWEDSQYSRFRASWGAYRSATYWNLWMIRRYQNKHVDPLRMTYVKSILDLCASRGTHVIVVMNPVHADHLEILDLLGLWPEFENWKREIVELAAIYPNRSVTHNIPVWDFSAYYSYTIETLPTDNSPSYWFLDSSHYTRALGDLIVHRIFGGGDASFGTLLDQSTIDSHLSMIREQQQLYRELHRKDVMRVHQLYDAAVGTLPDRS